MQRQSCTISVGSVFSLYWEEMTGVSATRE